MQITLSEVATGNSSAAASLNSGADLQIDTQTLTNTSSLITAAGDINVKAETVHNQGLQPQEITTLRRYWSFVNETGNAAAHAAAFNARNNPTPSASFASDLSREHLLVPEDFEGRWA